VEEPALDTQRVPSAATETQSESDALTADPDRHEAQPGITETDPMPGEATDLPNGDGEETVAGTDEESEADFNGFEDIGTRGPRHVSTKQSDTALDRVVQAPVVINRSVAEQEAYDNELVPIIPRRTQMRNYVGGVWYNLIKGQEQFVPRTVADHFRDKGWL
jgi:hypothetical protein